MQCKSNNAHTIANPLKHKLEPQGLAGAVLDRLRYRSYHLYQLAKQSPPASFIDNQARIGQ
jgi:hypothetical protein